MPAAASSIQVFGRRDSRETQKALRFFRERRVPIAYVDVARKPPAPTELRRFRDRIGVAALVDRDGRAWRESGLGFLTMGEDELFARLLAEPRLLRLPLVRRGAQVSVGVAETAWRDWLSS